ncbi:MAG: T9SS type A sorting domain-containing protein [Bacteroidota bacterium]|nr:T9SS type A sorting domain-containing protein [Bacteroidota bacterium]
MRIQASRASGGNYIVYSWAESDTIITTNASHWNEFPNLKVRVYRICDGSLSGDDYNITDNFTVLAAVRDKTYFHYLSPNCKTTSQNATSATFLIGTSVSNNTYPPNSLAKVNHYFSSVAIQFSFTNGFFGGGSFPLNCYGVVKINESSNNINSLELYSNPTFKELNVDLSSSENKTYTYNINDLAGKQIKKSELSGNKNNSLNVSELMQGVYIFNVLDAGRIIGVKKFVKE